LNIEYPCIKLIKEKPMEDIKTEDSENLEDIPEETEPLGSENENEEEKEEEVGEEETDNPIDPDKIEIETRGVSEDKVDYGEDVDEEDIKTIGNIVEKQTASVKKALQDTQDRLEVDSYVNEHPEFIKYKPVILKYIQHPVYNKIPVKYIASMVASNDLLKIGAEKERVAQKKADATKTPTNTIRKPEAPATDWTKASKEEFEQHKRRVLQGI
jgi:hypothetical protein